MSKVLEEIDFLKLSRMDMDLERIMMGIQLGRNHLENLKNQGRKRSEERQALYNALKKKYEVDDFQYDENGMIKVNKPEDPSKTESPS